MALRGFPRTSPPLPGPVPSRQPPPPAPPHAGRQRLPAAPPHRPPSAILEAGGEGEGAEGGRCAGSPPESQRRPGGGGRWRERTERNHLPSAGSPLPRSPAAASAYGPSAAADNARWPRTGCGELSEGLTELRRLLVKRKK
ncbi:forkhead box protein G1-like [Calypte anna]|uniref:forkhead box protein G1-like n=1 Tax=Calypte anna TaxID=9244 RepID=UPI0011C45314|nr:forkhead box protein G1-like [Calypte anna]